MTIDPIVQVALITFLNGLVTRWFTNRQTAKVEKKVDKAHEDVSNKLEEIKKIGTNGVNGATI